MRTRPMAAHFLSADWSKRPEKRSVYLADCRNRRIEKREAPGADWNLKALLGVANDLSQDGPVLIGVDVVLGVPEGYWRRVVDAKSPHPPETFVDWLRFLDPSVEFFETVVEPDDWCVDRPWFRVAKGVGGRTRFTSKVAGGLRRRIDRATGGNPMFAVSGIPGSVGSATRELWQELVPHLIRGREFAIWPFDGCLNSLLDGRKVVLCETYPRLAYAVALADDLPTGRIRSAKTKSEWRNEKCDLLARAEWVRANRVCLGDLGPLRSNDDNFDAHFTAAAVLRCVCEKTPLADPNWVDEKAEGSMLLAGVVELPEQGQG